MRRNTLRLLTPYEVRLAVLGQLREHSLDRIADASAPLLAAILRLQESK